MADEVSGERVKLHGTHKSFDEILEGFVIDATNPEGKLYHMPEQLVPHILNTRITNVLGMNEVGKLDIEQSKERLKKTVETIQTIGRLDPQKFGNVLEKVKETWESYPKLNEIYQEWKPFDDDKEKQITR